MIRGDADVLQKVDLFLRGRRTAHQRVFAIGHPLRIDDVPQDVHVVRPGARKGVARENRALGFHQELQSVAYSIDHGCSLVKFTEHLHQRRASTLLESADELMGGFEGVIARRRDMLVGRDHGPEEHQLCQAARHPLRRNFILFAGESQPLSFDPPQAICVG